MQKAGQAATVVLLVLSSAFLLTMPPAVTQAASPESCFENPRNPILNASGGYTYTTSTGNWFAYNNTFQEPTVVRTSGGLRLWYAGYVGGVWGIYTATSEDGGNWTIDSTPVLTSGPSGSWDAAPIHAPSVLYNGSEYLMYFRGSNGTSVHSRSIGVAFSMDGIHWTEFASNPVLKPGPGSYDSNLIYDANVIFKDGIYQMWYAASPANQPSEYIDFATSQDGVHWTKYADNPVFLGSNDQIGRVGHPDVVGINGTLLMLYGDGSSIRYAVSHTGTSWTPMLSDLVSSAQAYWKSDYVSDPAASLAGSELILWYYGNSPIRSPSSPYIAGVGLARCGLVIVQMSTTTTAVLTSTLVQGTTSTITFVSTTTISGPAASLAFFEGTTIATAATAFVLVYLLARKRPR